jgi:hypothetical protein
MPTLMWHGDTGNTIGHTFKGFGSENYVQLDGQNTMIKYYQLGDERQNPVGRIFPDLHTFTIDDQELVTAMSYKSNRNWSTPTLEWDTTSTVDGVIDGTESLYVTYLLASNTGYTTGLHNQNIICVNFDQITGECVPTDKKSITVNLPPDQLSFMNTTGTTGWYADRLYILAQKTNIDDIPTPGGWKIIDYTSQISSHTLGNRIDPLNLENSTFTINNSDYLSGTTYNLNDWIDIPTTAEPDELQFGDERFLYGNVRTSGITTKYRTNFKFTIAPTQFNTSVNPTYDGSGQNIHISEVGIYSGTDLVAIGKLNLPIEKTSDTTVIIEMAFDL